MKPLSVARFGQAQRAELAAWERRVADAEHIRYELVEHSEVAGPLRAVAGDRTFRRGLEVGIGPYGLGFLAVHIGDRIEEIFGLDPLARLELRISDRAFGAEIDGIRGRVNYIRGMGESIPFASGTFDIVSCINVVDHAMDPALIVAECDRVLKAGGLLVFGVNTLSVLGELAWKLRGALRRRDWFFEAHPHTFLWGRADRMLECAASNTRPLWSNKPALDHRLAGHGRMSFWIRRKR